MANVAIQIKVGSHPDNFTKGIEYYFSVAGEDTKISSDALLRVIAETLEKKIEEKYGEIKSLR